MTDTWDDMRASTFDLTNPDGSPVTDLDTLLGALGAYGQPRERQADALRNWLHSAAAKPAPAELVEKAEAFVRG